MVGKIHEILNEWSPWQASRYRKRYNSGNLKVWRRFTGYLELELAFNPLCER